MTNTIIEITNTVAPINGIDVVKQVNDFYSSSFGYAFNHILWLLGILIGLLGVVVPLVYYFLQNRQLELKEKNLEKKLTETLRAEFEEFKKLLREENVHFLNEEKKTTHDKFESMEAKTNKRLSHAVGGIFMVQGNFEDSRKNYTSAFTSYMDAVNSFSKISGFKLVQTNLRYATDQLKGMNKTHFADEALVKKVNEVIAAVEKLEAKGLLDEDLKKFHVNLSEAKARDN